MSVKKCPKNFQMSEQYLGFLDKMSEVNFIPAETLRSHTFLEIDYEIISMVIFLPSAESFKKDCCQLQVKVCTGSTS